MQMLHIPFITDKFNNDVRMFNLITGVINVKQHL